MKDKTLYRICIIVSLIGIISLYFSIYHTEHQLIPLEEVNRDKVGSNVRTEGVIAEKTITSQGHVFYEIVEDDESIEVAIFDNLIDDFNINPAQIDEGSKIEVFGEVDIYQNELQIIPRRIEVISQ